MSHRSVFIGCLALLAIAVVGSAPPASAATGRAAIEASLAGVDTLYARGQVARANARLDSLVAAAHANGDRALENAATVRRASAWVFFRRYDDAVRDAQTAISAARAMGDTLTWARALLVIGRAHAFRSRFADAAPVYRQLLPLARALRQPGLEGNARLGLAYLDLQAGRSRAAATGYRAAVALLQRSPERASEFSARVGLARALYVLDDLAGAKAAYREVIARAHALGDLYDEADAWNNLGVIESEHGDPAHAAAFWSYSLALNRRAGRPVLRQLGNLAILLVNQGRTEEAVSLLETELARPASPGDAEARDELRTQLAVARRAQYRYAEAEQILRAQLARADSLAADEVANALNQLGLVLLETRRAEECRTMLREAPARYRLPESGAIVDAMRIVRARAENSCGHPAEALAALAAFETSIGRPGLRDPARVTAEVERARARRQLGDLDGAALAAREGARAWERARAATRSADWLEVIGNGSGSLSVETARILLDPRRGGTESSRAADAFDALQRFKARALQFRLSARDSGSAGSSATFVTSAELRGRVLRPGEALIDFYSSRNDTTLAFVVDRSGVIAHWIDADGPLLERLERLQALVRTSDSGPDRAVTEAIGRTLAGPAYERLCASRRVLVVPSSMVGIVPFGLLFRAAGANDHETAYLPSANWLAHRRARGSVQVRDARVVQVARSTGPAGRELPGVREETRWLAARFGARGIVHGGDRPLGQVTPWLARGDVLHVAAHADVPREDPWSSALLLGKGDSDEAQLTARDLAGQPLAAKLVVLTSCSGTAYGKFGNEGASGLSTAFLAAGAPAVVSSIWPVDDRGAAAFSRAFYRQLERGQTVAAALSAARRELAADPGTRSPAAWAAFVLWGDPEARVTVRPRGPAILPILP